MATREINVRVRQTGAGKVRKDVTNIGRAASQARTHVLSLRSALSAISLGQAVFQSINVLRNFGQEMSTVKAITNSTGSVFQSLREEARRLGATTRFTATNAAEGMSFLGRAGFNTQQILKSTSSTLTLAQAGALGLGRAADIVSNVMITFGASASQTSDYVDVMAFTANNANTNVDQLGQAMKFAAPVSHALGLSVRETSAAIGVLSDAGLQADMAGTGLRQFFLKLLNPTNNTTRVLKKLGLTLGDVDVSTRGLLPVLQTLADKNISVADTFKLFEARGGNAALVLIDAIPKMRRLGEAMNSVGGYANRVAREMNDNLNGAILSVQSRAQELVLSLGDLGLERGLTDMMWGLADVLATVAANAESLLPVIYSLAALLAGTLVRAAYRAGLALAALALSNPFTALLVAIPAVVAAVHGFGESVVLSTNQGTTLRDVMDEAWVAIKDGARGAGDAIDEHINGALREGDGLGAMLGSFWVALKRDLSNNGSIFAELLKRANERNRLKKEGNDIVAALTRGLEIGDEPFEDPNKLSLQRAPKTADFDVDALIKKYQERIDLFDIDPTERQAALEFWRLENKLLEQGIELSDEKAAVLEEALKGAVADLEVLTAKDKILEKLRGADNRRLVDQQALNQLLDEGQVSLKEYNQELLNLQKVGLGQGNLFDGLKLGLIELNQMTQNFGQEVSNWLTSSFGKISDAMASMVEEGKISLQGLKQVLASVLADLAKVLMRRALLQAVSFIPFAQGGVIGPSGPLTAYASGGVVDTPTFFGHGGGLGLMGEAGPEAILPLTRGKNGKLGVQAAGGGNSKQTNISVTYNNHFEGGGSGNIEEVVQQALVENNKKVYDLVKEAERRRG